MYTYIIVDDEPLIRSGIRSKIDRFAQALQLACLGEASNGREALELIASQDPQIIVTDMRMPGVDGRQLLTLLKQQYPEKPIIVISGYKDYEYMLGAIEAQATGYLLKPFSREEVEAAMAKAIQAIEAAASARALADRLERMREQADVDLCRDGIELGRSMAAASVLQSAFGNKLQAMPGYILLVEYIPEAEQSALREQLSAVQPAYAIPGSMLQWQYTLLPLAEPGAGEQILQCLQDSAVSSAAATEVAGTASAAGTAGATGTASATGATDVAGTASPVGATGATGAADAACAANTKPAPLAPVAAGRWLAAASLPKLSLAQLHEAYLECRSAMDASPAGAARGYWQYAANSERAGAKEGLLALHSWHEMDKCLYLLEKGQLDAAQAHLRSTLFQPAAGEPGKLTWGAAKQRCRLLITAIAEAASHGRLRATADRGKQAGLALEQGYEQQAIVAAMEQLMQEAAPVEHDGSPSSPQQLAQQIKSYIEDHYKEELTLQKLSQRFYINASYCSHLFKEKTGMNISEFLLAKRLEKAKELLIQTEYPLERIARMVGYSNDKYLIRIFKKAAGCTPQAYRQSKRNHES